MARNKTRKKALHIVRRKLGRERARGQYYGPGSRYRGSAPRIEVDSRLEGCAELEVVIHEALHHAFPDLTEDAVERADHQLARVLWSMGYRKRKPNGTKTESFVVAA